MFIVCLYSTGIEERRGGSNEWLALHISNTKEHKYKHYTFTDLEWEKTNSRPPNFYKVKHN